MGFTANFCHKHDPETKAKIESSVHIIKQGFLKGRVYTGIDSLNAACLERLDRFANVDYHHTTKRIPKEMFKEEYKTYQINERTYIDLAPLGYTLSIKAVK